ncbi:Tubulin-specific chaperone E, partial [Armadillidium nasatum]
MEVKIGDRVDNNGYRGTIKWIGEIPSVNGIWYGVDWDDENRGKHNGTHNGIQYFTARNETSGSFVRPSKVNLGMSLEQAIKGRYQDDVTIEEVLTSQLKHNIKARFVEVVGMEKVGKKQSQLDALQTVVLDGWLVRDGGDTDLGSLLPRLQDLDLSNTLLSSWEDIAHITKQLPNLKFINVSGNELRKPSNPLKLMESTQHVTHVVMNKMLTYAWDDLIWCLAMFPFIKKLQLAYNNLESLGPIPPGVFEHLVDIDLGVNPIGDWSEICHLSKLP